MTIKHIEVEFFVRRFLFEPVNQPLCLTNPATLLHTDYSMTGHHNVRMGSDTTDLFYGRDDLDVNIFGMFSLRCFSVIYQLIEGAT